MAVNETRSMRDELEIGATEGSYKSTWPDRGGEIAEETLLAREPYLDTSRDRNGTVNTALGRRHLPTGRWAKHRPSRR